MTRTSGQSDPCMVATTIAACASCARHGGAGRTRWRVVCLCVATVTCLVAVTAVPRLGSAPTRILTLRQLTVNLADPGRHYVMVGLGLLLGADASIETIRSIVPIYRDAVIGHISGRVSSELSTPAGRASLRASLTELAQSVFGSRHVVTGVIFTDLTVE